MKKFMNVIKGILWIILFLILFIASPILWPVYLGVLVLHPELLERLWSKKIF